MIKLIMYTIDYFIPSTNNFDIIAFYWIIAHAQIDGSPMTIAENNEPKPVAKWLLFGCPHCNEMNRSSCAPD